MNTGNISVILPCFNERGNIIPLVNALQKSLNNYKYEIIIVDDNSSDGTFDLVVSANLNHVKIFLRDAEPSLAASIRFGIEMSSGEYIVIMDSDFNHRPQDVPILVENLKFYDCVIASRFVYGGSMPTYYRRIGSWMFNIMLRIITKSQITDALFGFISIRRAALDGLKFDEIFYGYGDYCIRLLSQLQRKNKNILQIPGVLGERLSGQGNSRLLKTLIQYLFSAIKLAVMVRKKGAQCD